MTNEISFCNTTFFNLYEYCGLDKNSKKSNFYYIKDNLLEHLDINEINIIKNIIFNDKQNNLLAYIYHFDFIFDKEKSIYEQIAYYKCIQ